ncbi:penicillin-binding protein [Virgibacillus pantothenticus]|uniref:serine-type D-Ala-D-Ala carboxypeptidase n=1 Tax=Virgibacillus pantothenticus TaxID=1473 RepID=A0A0L0QN87_VIRPA|nr:penicillin-binding protein [Virgibacillus pantothenticus]KNE20080.1 penicillin-binding protein [Virgibacillus pantothenticus]QTY18170.1 penicillin-binding protein [Virgibacillus pantothenticus]SIS58500.1 penicillin-binding protein 2B [Virgibacillus pantothenticus]
MRKNKTTHFMAGIFIILFVGIFLTLSGRFLYIQATAEIDGVSLKKWADKQRTSTYKLPAERGKIYDNNGMTLAYDQPSYRIFAIVQEAYSDGAEEPRHVKEPRKTAEQLAPLLDMKESDIEKRLQEGIDNDRFQVEFGNKGRQLSLQKKEEIEELELPGIHFKEETVRAYPNGTFASQIIGFAKEMEIEGKEENATTQQLKGVTGIEKEMDKHLRGKDGYIAFQRDKYNKKLLDPKEVVKKNEDGGNIYLTIDQKIQTLLEDTLTQVEKKYEPERISAVVMNPKTGEVIAMGNRPSYNPNNPTDVENWYNDVVSTPFEPGSTMKMFTWAAAIEEGVYNGTEAYKSGQYQPNEKIKPVRDHNGGAGWGPISYNEGFERSSNVAASKLVWEKIGSDKYLEYLKAFQFDQKTNIDLPNEVAGKILYNWPAEKLTTAFGQDTTMTPIQQMKAATAIANNGKMLQPYIIDKLTEADKQKPIKEKQPKVVGEPISKATSKQVLQLLDLAVNGEHATGKNFQLDGYKVGGKTGTAQIPNPDGGYLIGRENYIFSFLGMAPIDNPQLMMYVSVKQPKLGEKKDGSLEMGSDPVAFIFKHVMENGLHYLNIDPDKQKMDNVKHIEIPSVVGKSGEAVAKELTEKGLRVTTTGKGKILKSNVQEGDQVLPNDHIMLITEKPKMPQIIGWSLRDALQLANLLELKTETFGDGYVATQNIKAGVAIKPGDYLGIELEPPNKQKKQE